MTWILIVGLAWALLALAAALLIGRTMRLADERDRALQVPVVPDYVPADFFQSVRPGAAGSSGTDR